MESDPLAVEKRYLKAHQAELAEAHPGRFLLIKGEAVRGAFETYDQGVTAGAELFGAGPFLVRSVLHPDDPNPPGIPTLSLGVPLVANR